MINYRGIFDRVRSKMGTYDLKEHGDVNDYTRRKCSECGELRPEPEDGQ